MHIRRINPIERIKKETSSLENKLLRFFIYCELLWALVNGVASFGLKMPKETIMVFAGIFCLLLIYIFADFIFKSRQFLPYVYFVGVLLTRPVIWYFSGGSRSSANILFVSELVLFVMCMRGTKQKIFILISLFTTSMTQNLSRNLPDPVFIMDEKQYQQGGAVLGLTTSLLIAALLILQKKEYMKERDAAIETKKDLEKSNSLQKNFLANMSHEIRSPLGIVMGFNNLIKDSDDVEQIHEYSKDITEAGSTLLTVINDILDYSKIESGKLDIIEDDYYFHDLIEEIRRDVALKCAEKGLKFAARIDESIPNGLHGDNIRIKQCLINILSNAVKYTEKGGILFQIQCVDVKDDEYRIKFIVRDTGKGISEEALPNIFSAFQRLDEGMNRGIEGTGLGMAITKNLLDEMGGTIEVESQLGVGSTFTMELTQRKGAETKKEEKVDDTCNLEGVKVLVVDDTELNLILVNKLLQKEMAEVTTINNGKDGLADMEMNKYDIIFLDHMMPEMNGVEVFERMKAGGGINHDTPVVMLTANAMAGAMKEYMDMGFNGYLSKPIRPNELKEIILRLTGRNSEGE